MLIPGTVYLIINNYLPMAGLIIAFNQSAFGARLRSAIIFRWSWPVRKFSALCEMACGKHIYRPWRQAWDIR